MVATIVLATAIAGLSAAAVLPRAETTAVKPFVIEAQVLSTKGNAADFKGYYLNTFHVGAGQSTIVATKNKTNAAPFYVNPDAYLAVSLNRTDIPDAVVGLQNFRPYMSSAPNGYNYISLNNGEGDGTKGFGITHNAGGSFYVGYAGQGVPAYDHFALCAVNGTSPYFSLGPQHQLLWATKKASRQDCDCAEVALKIVSK